MVKKNRVAIIPARGGSKRIPRKNILDLGGKPMIAYTIQAALDSGCFDSVIVSTDDKEIAEVSLEYGAEVPFLRDKHNDDHATVSQATVYTLNELQKRSGVSYKTVVQLMANCPIRDAKDIVDACTFFDKSEHNFQLSAFKYGWMNPWWAHQLDEASIAIPIFDPEIRNRRSQDQPDLFCPTGAIWIADVAKIMKAETFYGNGYSFFPLSWQSAVDIDDYEDFEFAKILLS